MHLVNQSTAQPSKVLENGLVTNEVLLNLEERNCMEHFAETVTRKTNEHFVVRMPIKEAKIQQLDESRSTALSRFLSLEHKVQKQPKIV